MEMPRENMEERTMNIEKKSLELVDEFIRETNEAGYRWSQLLNIKSAIEREQKNEDDEYSALLQISADRARIIVDLTAQLKSAITMRPISELPDRVPDECDCVMVDSHGVTMCKTYATHFYILPLPKAERKLHPCYMPGCGGEAKIEKTFTGRQYAYCEQCGAHGPVCGTMQEAKDAWGYE